MKLPRLQFHLITGIVLMFVAGGLMWANLTPIRRYYPFHDTYPNGYVEKGITMRIERGWPIGVQVETPGAIYVNSGLLAPPSLHLDALYINIPTALALLAAAAFVCEWLIRKRALKVKG